jgi:uncharacterized protein YukE
MNLAVFSDLLADRLFTDILTFVFLILSATSALSQPIHAPGDVTHQSIRRRSADFDFDVLQPRAGKTKKAVNNGIRTQSANTNWKTWGGSAGRAAQATQRNINNAKSQLAHAKAQMRQIKNSATHAYANTDKAARNAWGS